MLTLGHLNLEITVALQTQHSKREKVLSEYLYFRCMLSNITKTDCCLCRWPLDLFPFSINGIIIFWKRQKFTGHGDSFLTHTPHPNQSPNHTNWFHKTKLLSIHPSLLFYSNLNTSNSACYYFFPPSAIFILFWQSYSKSNGIFKKVKRVNYTQFTFHSSVGPIYIILHNLIIANI